MALVPAPPRTAVADLAADVRAGLRRTGRKELPCTWFYDDAGSALFEAISLLPEYGLTRADERILRSHADEIADRVAPATVAELGSGSGRKTRWILGALAARQPAIVYYPIEISAPSLARCERELGRLPSVRIVPLQRSYMDGLAEVADRRRRDERLLLLFLGSSIGNFSRAEGARFLRDVRSLLLAGDTLLLGTDLVKPVATLLAAYDDPAGVTAAFNLNILHRINRELDADFDLPRFEHVAIWNAAESSVEMHIRSLADQTVRIPGAGILVRLERGETIRTERSHKYTRAEIDGMARAGGFTREARWIDDEWPFAETLLRAV